MNDRYKYNECNEVFKNRYKRTASRIIPFLVFCSCGMAGMVIDLDHFDQILQAGTSIIWENITGRGLHIPYFLSFCFILLSCVTLVYRLFTVVLENEV